MMDNFFSPATVILGFFVGMASGIAIMELYQRQTFYGGLLVLMMFVFFILSICKDVEVRE